MTNHEVERNNKGLCACCGRQPVSTDSDGVALRFCIACRVRIAPKPQTRIDLDERVTLLEAFEDNLRARLLNAEKPQIMLEHAAHLERQAQILIEKANAIRFGVQVDSSSVGEIRESLRDCSTEKTLLQYCIRRGWKVRRIEKMIEMLLKREKRGDFNADV